MERKIRVIDNLFRVIFVLTLIAGAAYLVFLLRQPTDDDIFGHLFDFIIAMQIFFPPVMAEIEVYFTVKYFLQPKDRRRAYKTVINTICSAIWSIMAVFCMVVFIDYLLNDFNDAKFALLEIWLYLLFVYLPLRIIYVLIGISKEKRGAKGAIE